MRMVWVHHAGTSRDKEGTKGTKSFVFGKGRHSTNAMSNRGFQAIRSIPIVKIDRLENVTVTAEANTWR